MKKIIKFFEVYFGWFFIIGHKQERWHKHIDRKYNK